MIARARPPCAVSILLGAALLSALVPAPAMPQSTVRGTVIEDASRQPITVVELRLIDADGEMRGRAMTDAEGVFRLDVPAGVYSLAVRRVGYAAIDAHDIRLVDDGDMELQVRLAPQAVVIDAVTVVADRRGDWGRLGEQLDRAERNRRMGRGQVYFREDIARLSPGSLSSLVDPYFWGTQCTPAVYLNGMPTEGSLYAVTADQLEGLELYRERDPIPQEYYRSGMCGLALLWTRPEQRPWSWARAAVGGVLIVLVGLVVR